MASEYSANTPSRKSEGTGFFFFIASWPQTIPGRKRNSQKRERETEGEQRQGEFSNQIKESRWEILLKYVNKFTKTSLCVWAHVTSLVKLCCWWTESYLLVVGACTHEEYAERKCQTDVHSVSYKRAADVICQSRSPFDLWGLRRLQQWQCEGAGWKQEEDQTAEHFHTPGSLPQQQAGLIYQSTPHCQCSLPIMLSKSSLSSSDKFLGLEFLTTTLGFHFLQLCSV